MLRFRRWRGFVSFWDYRLLVGDKVSSGPKRTPSRQNNCNAICCKWKSSYPARSTVTYSDPSIRYNRAKLWVNLSGQHPLLRSYGRTGRLLHGSSTVSHNCPSGMPYLQGHWLVANRPSRKRTVRWNRQTVLLLLISTIIIASSSPLSQWLQYSFRSHRLILRHIRLKVLLQRRHSPPLDSESSRICIQSSTSVSRH